MSLVLHWFRSDLRIHDNRALAAAQAEGPVVALYIATPAQWDSHDDAPIKRDFWRRNLQMLERQLHALGIPLLYCETADYRGVPALLGELLQHWQVQSLHCNREYPLNERRRDESIDALCHSLNVRFTRHDDQVLCAPEKLFNKSGQPFRVFTPFARALRSRIAEEGLGKPVTLRIQEPVVLASLAQCCSLDALPWPHPDPAWAMSWPAGEQYASRQLDLFCDERIADYREQRDFPAVPGTSRLSPVLAAGVLSIRECWRRAEAWQQGSGVQAWQNELLWREFYRHVVHHFPRVSRHQAWREDVEHVPWRHDADGFQAWCEGRTGIPIIDAAQRQLLQSGWMHNRLRMLSAMFLTKHLLIDWRWGERWFMQHLVDGDFAANNGGWQWSASTGTDAAPYFRIFNPVTQSRRFDPDGAFIRQYVPELAALDAKTIHEPGLLRPAGYPPPLLELAFGRERALTAFRPR